jgi:hypothetical protein
MSDLTFVVEVGKHHCHGGETESCSKFAHHGDYVGFPSPWFGSCDGGAEADFPESCFHRVHVAGGGDFVGFEELLYLFLNFCHIVVCPARAFSKDLVFGVFFGLGMDGIQGLFECTSWEDSCGVAIFFLSLGVFDGFDFGENRGQGGGLDGGGFGKGFGCVIVLPLFLLVMGLGAPDILLSRVGLLESLGLE